MLPFGKIVKTKHFVLFKYSKSLSKKEAASLRKNLPSEITKHLQRASLPYIKVSDIRGSWGVEFAVGTSMYSALDNCEPTLVDGHCELTGLSGDNVDIFAQLMFTDTTLVGDDEYYIGKMKLRDEYVKREVARRMEAEKGKTEEQRRKESDEAVQEVIDREKHASALLDMAAQLKKDEGGENDD